MNLYAPYPINDEFTAEAGRKHALAKSGYTPKSIVGLTLIVAAVISAMLLTNCAPSSYRTVAGGKIVWENGRTPAGWPAPGPLNQVTVQRYPAYRSAVAEVFSESDGSLKLHAHLRATNIPMGSPVEMGGVFEDKGWQIKSMSFPYPDARLGKAGFADPSVVVRDNIGGRALSYAWVGDRDDAHLMVAKAALDQAVRGQRNRPGAYRLLISSGGVNQLETMIR